MVNPSGRVDLTSSIKASISSMLTSKSGKSSAFSNLNCCTRIRSPSSTSNGRSITAGISSASTCGPGSTTSSSSSGTTLSSCSGRTAPGRAESGKPTGPAIVVDRNNIPIKTRMDCLIEIMFFSFLSPTVCLLSPIDIFI